MRQGAVGFGEAELVWIGKMGLGVVRRGLAEVERTGQVGMDEVGKGRKGMARRGTARFGRTG